MKNIRILSIKTNRTLYQGRYESLKDCLEDAAMQRIDLAYADLRYADLSNAHLDDALMAGADLQYANLSGANLSEAYLPGTSFKNAALYNTCLAFSDLQRCNFEDASFGATDINGAQISGAVFSSLSCFTLDFDLTANMENCRFINKNGIISRMSRPPVVVKGLCSQPLIFMDNHVQKGHKIISFTNSVNRTRINAARGKQKETP